MLRNLKKLVLQEVRSSKKAVEEEKLREKKRRQVKAIAFSSTGEYFATGGRDNVITLWGVKKDKENEETEVKDKDKELLFQLEGHVDRVVCLAFIKEVEKGSLTLFSGSWDKTIKGEVEEAVECSSLIF